VQSSGIDEQRLPVAARFSRIQFRSLVAVQQNLASLSFGESLLRFAGISVNGLTQLAVSFHKNAELFHMAIHPGLKQVVKLILPGL
jgi:hypothetical protein